MRLFKYEALVKNVNNINNLDDKVNFRSESHKLCMQEIFFVSRMKYLPLLN